MIRPIAVEVRDEYRIWLKFEDGEAGEVDLSHLVVKGVFKAWQDPKFFRDVRIFDGDTILWGDENRSLS